MRALSRVGGLALLLLATGAAGAGARDGCAAPEPVCAARDAVFAVRAFDPHGSAVRIGPDLLVTSRHGVADAPRATLRLPDGGEIEAEVVPTSYEGDLVLLRADLPDGPALAPAGDASGVLRAVGQDIGTGRVRVFPEGRLLFEPEADRPLARLHHTAHGQPGVSGGALVDADGRLVGIVASGGEGRFEAVPAAAIARLRAASGPEHAAASAEIGRAVRDCVGMLEAAGYRDPDEAAAARLEDRCLATRNRQLYDLAAQALGRARLLDRSVALFERSLEQDPNAVNARLGLAVALVFAGRHADAAPHVRRLVDAIPEEPRVHQFAVRVGKLADRPDLIEAGLALIEKHNPAQLEAARRFLAAPVPPPR